MLFSPAGRLIVDEKRSEEGLHEVASAEEGDYQVRKLYSHQHLISK